MHRGSTGESYNREGLKALLWFGALLARSLEL